LGGFCITKNYTKTVRRKQLEKKLETHN